MLTASTSDAFAAKIDNKNSCLHNCSSSVSCKKRFSGFSLVELLIVVLVIGIFSGVGISAYSGLSSDTAARTQSDEISSFFEACRQRAKLRKIPVTIHFDGSCLFIEQTTTLRQITNGITPDVGAKILDGITAGIDGVFYREGKQITSLEIPVVNPGDKRSVLDIKL